MARLISYPTISTVASGDLFPVTDMSDVNKPLKNITAVDLQAFVNDGATLQRVISTGNTYQASPSDALWTWGIDAITVTSTSFTSILSGKRFKTTLVADGSFTDVLPNQLIFNTAIGNETSITPNIALSSNIDLQWPSSSGILALTTDIISSPWDTVSAGINYAGGNVGIGTTSPSASLDVATISSGPVAKFVNTSGTGGAGVVIQAGVATSSSILTLFDYQNNERLRVRGDGNVGIGTTSPGAALEVVGGGLGAKFVSINTTALEVQGGANAQDIARFKNTIGDAKFVIGTNGDVGIGTTSPSEKLHVNDGNVLIANSSANTNLTISPITNNAQINSNKNIRFSIGNDNKFTIQDSGVIFINAIGTGAATANLVCSGSFKLGNSMSSNPANQPNLTAADAGTMTYHEGANRSRLFMVMKTGENPDVYEQVVIKDNVY